MEFDRQTKRGKEAEGRAQRTTEAAEAFAEAADLHAQAQAQERRAEALAQGSEKGDEKRGSPSKQDKGNIVEADEKDDAASATQPVPFIHNLDRAQAALESGNPYEAATIPLRLASIRIEGAKNLRPSFLSALCRPYMDATLKPEQPLHRLLYAHRLGFTLPGQPTSIPALLALTQSLGQDLSSFDIFSDIAASLTPAISPNGASSSSTAASLSQSAQDVDVVLRCQEKGRFFLKTSTEVGNGEGNGVVQARIRNVLGGAESLEGSASIGTKTRKSFAIALVSPLFASPDHSVSLSAFAQDRDLTSYASCVEGVRGGRAALTFNAGPLLGLHELAYEAQHRHVGRLLPTASMSMRRLAGHTVKSAISHTVTSDTRDDAFMATRGRLLRLHQEYAGLGGDANHYKVEGEGQISRAFGRGWAASLSARGGALTTLNGVAPRFSDRFQLGGPISLRMFRFHSLGPRDGVDSLGGNAFWAVGASLLAPIPSRPDWPLKIHSFFNAGQLALVQGQGKGLSNAWQELVQPSSSFGVGLMYMQSGLRVELNAGLPLTARKGDGHRKGIQLGIGISFL